MRTRTGAAAAAGVAAANGLAAEVGMEVVGVGVVGIVIVAVTSRSAFEWAAEGVVGLLIGFWYRGAVELEGLAFGAREVGVSCWHPFNAGGDGLVGGGVAGTAAGADGGDDAEALVDDSHERVERWDAGADDADGCLDL